MANDTGMTDAPSVSQAQELSLELGQRLRSIRERNGLSQRELAKRAGVTNSNISMIEQGQVSPSINSLARLLGGIPMTLAQFFACDLQNTDSPVYSAKELQQKQVLGPGGFTRERLAVDKPDRRLDTQRQTFPAGCDTGAEPLRAQSEVTGMLISGQLELTLGMQVHHLHQGDGFYLLPQQPFRVRNLGASDAVLVVTSLK